MSPCAVRLLPQEHAMRWREFWASKQPVFSSFDLAADVDNTCVAIYRGAALVAIFTPADTPIDIEAQLSQLVGGAS